MAAIEASIEVEVAVASAYNQWTQFEQFPRFMEGISSVVQIDPTHLHFVAAFGGREHEWDAEIVEQVPDERVAWRDVHGTTNSGAVTFEALGPHTTRVTVRMDWEPEGVVERIGQALGFDERRVQTDLKRFKELIESRGGRETGAWRGEV